MPEVTTLLKRLGVVGLKGNAVPSTPYATRYRMGHAQGSFPTAEDVLTLAARVNLQTTDASSPQDSTSGFAYHLEKERKVVIVDITQKLDSLWVTVECSSLRILEDLWNSYCREYLSELAQNTLVTKNILEELGLTNVKLKTTISEKEYRDCRVQFLQSLGEYERLLHLNTFSLQLFTFFQKTLIVSIVHRGEKGIKHERKNFPCS